MHLNFDDLSLALDGKLTGERYEHLVNCRACTYLIASELLNNPFINLMANLTEQQLKLAERLVELDDWNENHCGKAQLMLSLLLSERKRLIEERDEWKRRAAQHGCDTEDGDPDCG